MHECIISCFIYSVYAYVYMYVCVCSSSNNNNNILNGGGDTITCSLAVVFPGRRTFLDDTSF